MQSRPALFNFRKPWPWLTGLFLAYSLLGFFLVPWLVKTNLQAFTEERLGITTQVKSVRFNPWTLSLTLNQLKAKDSVGDDLLGLERFFINFQSSSLFRWAWSFDEVYLSGFYARVERFSEKESNISKLVQTFQETAVKTDLGNETETGHVGEAQDQAPPQVRFNDIKLHIDQITLIDHVPDSRFQQDIGPVHIEVQDLSTLPDATGKQVVRIATNNHSQISWSGDLTLVPFKSAGHVSITGPHLHLVTDYFKDILNFEIDRGTLKASFNYDISYRDSQLAIAIEQLGIQLTDFIFRDKSNNTPLLSWQNIALENGSLRYPDRQADIDSISLHNAELWLRKNPDGDINLNNLVNFPNNPSVTKEGEANQQSKTSDIWQISNRRFVLENGQVHAEDRQLPEPASFDIANINVEVHNASTLPDQPVTVTAQLSVANGQVNSSAKLNINPVANIEASYAVDQLQLSALQPYLSSMARVVLQSGDFSSRGQVSGDTVNSMKIKASANLNGLQITETDSPQILLGWQSLALDNALFDLSGNHLDINSLTFDQITTDFAVYPGGENTASRVILDKAEPTGAGISQETRQPDTSGPGSEQETVTGRRPFSYAINKIEFKQASGRFSDSNLPLPFAAEITDLNGNISSLVSNSETPAEINLSGRVDQYGEVRINGDIAAFAPLDYAAVNLSFRNVEMPDLTPYAIKFAGREIDSGKMDVNLEYAIKSGQLDSDNKIELYDLKLGKRVKHPDAMDLPLDMALALLKDSSGKIRLSLPVRGNVNDPKFGVGEVIAQAFRKVITSVVTSPFRLLAKIAGVENRDLGAIKFAPGKGDISPPELEKIHALASALQQRPDLKLMVTGAYDKKLDGLYIRKQQLETKISAALGADNDNMAKISPQYVRVVEKLYQALEKAPPLEETKALHTRVENDKQQLDSLSYVNALRDRLIQQETVAEETMLALANLRANQVQQAVLSANESLASRLQLQPSVATTSKNEWVTMKLDVSTRAR